MNLKGVAVQPEWLRGKCPFCNKKLSNVEKIRRKARKICKCNSCGRIIDERFLIR